MNVVSEFELSEDAEDAGEDDAYTVDVEGPSKAVEGVVWNLLVEEDLIGETTCEHWNTSNEAVSADESSEVDDDVSVEFPGEEAEQQDSSGTHSNHQTNVLIDIDQDEWVEHEAYEETSSCAQQAKTSSLDSLDEPSDEDGSRQSNNEAHDCDGDLSWSGFFALVKSLERTKNWS